MRTLHSPLPEPLCDGLGSNCLNLLLLVSSKALTQWFSRRLNALGHDLEAHEGRMGVALWLMTCKRLNLHRVHGVSVLFSTEILQ